MQPCRCAVHGSAIEAVCCREGYLLRRLLLGWQACLGQTKALFSTGLHSKSMCAIQPSNSSPYASLWVGCWCSAIRVNTTLAWTAAGSEASCIELVDEEWLQRLKRLRKSECCILPLISFSGESMPSTEAFAGRLALGLVWPYATHLPNSTDDEREDRCLAPESREVGVMERGVRRAGMRGAVMGATGRSAIPLLTSGMLPGPPMVGAAGMDPYGLVLMPTGTHTHLLRYPGKCTHHPEPRHLFRPAHNQFGLTMLAGLMPI